MDNTISLGRVTNCFSLLTVTGNTDFFSRTFFYVFVFFFFSGQSTILVTKLHAKLLVLEAGDETRERALMAVRLLASHNALTVIDSLLNDHSLPFDEALVSCAAKCGTAHICT